MADMKQILKATIRKAANAMGYDVVAFDNRNGRWRMVQLLAKQRVTVLFDVGANFGHFAWDMRELGFTGRIISFEPLKDAFAHLEAATKNDADWQAVNIGLGDRDEARLLHVAANSQSSSFLPMLDAHRIAAPESQYQAEELTTVSRLDGIFSHYCSDEDRVFLKIDTQGFEKFVLDGAHGVLHAIPLVQLECSMVPLYEGGQLIENMIGYMRAMGYDPVDALPIFYDNDTDHLMQADILFVRRNSFRST